MKSQIAEEVGSNFVYAKLCKGGELRLMVDYEWPGNVVFLKGTPVPKSLLVWDYVVLVHNEMTEAEFLVFLNKMNMKYIQETRILEFRVPPITLPDYPE